MKNHWIVTKDFIDNGENEGVRSVGFPFPAFAPNDLSTHPTELDVIFRLYDDDGNLYYEGRMMEEDFDPLDDFGEGYAGCTEIRTYSNGVWEAL